MGSLKLRTEKLATDVLRRAGVPETQLHSRMRKTGRGFLLGSILFIIPLVMFDDVSLWLKITLQVLYLLLVSTGVLLAFDEQENNRS